MLFLCVKQVQTNKRYFIARKTQTYAKTKYHSKLSSPSLVHRMLARPKTHLAFVLVYSKNETIEF